MTPDDLIRACRVPETVEARRVGLWELQRVDLRTAIGSDFAKAWMRSRYGCDHVHTMLFRDTIATLHHARGECVMEDSALELRRHLPILLAARGRVLISGLGLGCVVRGLLAKADVEHIDVVEIDPSIVDLCGHEFLDTPRVTLHLGDAETVAWPEGTRWNFAWHDVWSEDEHLDVVHARLLARYASMARHQGAWQLARMAKRAWPRPLLGQSRARLRELERAA